MTLFAFNAKLFFLKRILFKGMNYNVMKLEQVGLKVNLQKQQQQLLSF